MSITPLGFHAMIQRTNDIGQMKQNEDNKPILEQHNIQAQQVKHEDELTHKIARPDEKENDAYRYDAKEKGNGSYQEQEAKKKKKEQGRKSEDKVVLKGTGSRFDIKI